MQSTMNSARGDAVLTHFKVNFFNFSARDIRTKSSTKEGEEDKSGAASLYFKLDFDKGHTKIESKPVSKKHEEDSIHWGNSKAFEYATKHGDKLDHKNVRVSCWKYSMLFTDHEIGAAEVNLHDLATGPTCFDLVLRDSKSNPVGHFLFEATMEQIVDRAVLTLSDVHLRSAEKSWEAGIQLTIFYGCTAHVRVQSREHANPCTPDEGITWNDLPIVALQNCTCSDIAREDVFVLLSRKSEQIGIAAIRLGRYFVVDDITAKTFSVPVHDSHDATNIGELKGSLNFRNTPRLAQLVGGVYTEAGIVESSPGFSSRGAPHLMVSGAEKPKALQSADVQVQPFEEDHLEMQTQSPDATAHSASEEPRSPVTPSTARATFANVVLAKSKFKALLGPPEVDTRPEMTIQDKFDSDEVRALVKQLQQQHESTFAGLQQNFDLQKQKQRARLEQRLRMRETQRKNEGFSQQQQQQQQLAQLTAANIASEEAAAAALGLTAATSAMMIAPEMSTNNAPVVGLQTEQNVPEIQVSVIKDGSFKGGAQLSKRVEAILQEVEHSMFQQLDGRPPPTAALHPDRSMVPLPPRWQRRFDQYGESYYAYPRATDDAVFTTWEDPRLVPEDWEMRVDDSTGTIVFYNEPTGVTTVQDPRGLPLGWICFPDLDSNKLSFMHKEGVTDQDPRGLPPGWRAGIDPSKGTLVFYNDFMPGVVQTGDPRKLAGVSPDIRSMWKQMEMLEWLDMTRSKLDEKEQQQLNRDYQAVQVAFKTWTDNQQAIVSAQFQALQLNLLSLDPPAPTEESAEALRRFRAREDSLATGWKAEFAKVLNSYQGRNKNFIPGIYH